MGNAVIQFLRGCEGFSEHVAGMCFNTTSGNTGTHTGVIQEAFQQHILVLACRYHVLEITAGAVFDLFFVSKGAITPTFIQSKENWTLIDQSKYSSLDSETTRSSGCARNKREAMAREANNFSTRVLNKPSSQ